MFRTPWMLAVAMAVTGFAGLANAGTVLPGDSSVSYATNFNNVFNVNSTGESHADSNSQAIATSLLGSNPQVFSVKAATLTGYADAGIVLGFDGSLTLGQLQSVTLDINSGNTTPTINLWLDTGNDGHFFAFDGSGNLTGLNGDSYFGATTPGNINQSSSFSFLGGSVPGGTFTLSQFQNGVEPGIDGNTKVALWIGVTGTGRSSNFSFLNSVNVTAVPLPASVWSGMSILAGLGLFVGAKRMRARVA